MRSQERMRLIENIARLRRAERANSSEEVAAVREDLEAQMGRTVSRNLSARTLGVSHTALNNWIASGDVPVVVTESGRKEVPVRTLLELKERIDEERRSGTRTLHVLEPIMLEARRRAGRLRSAADPAVPAVPHGGADRRGLAYHRAVALRLRRSTITEAQRKLRRWQREGKVDARHAQAWEEVFALPMAAIRKAITADDQRGRDLRQNSPLAGLLSEPERRRILEGI
jgi:hypothetical protein